MWTLRRGLKRAAVAGALSAAISMCWLGLSGAATESASPHQDSVTVAVPSFGTLNTISDDAGAEKSAGLNSGMLELSWAAYEPQEGVFDEAYLQSITSWLAQLRAAGMSVTLGVGLHYTPPWVLGLPDSRYVDESGDTSDEADLVFSERVRNQAAAYLTHLAQHLDLTQVNSIRLTSGGNAEMLYPPGGGYWAFSAGAQNGSDRPPSMAPNPLPGWRPGSGGETAQQISSWLQWYVDGLDDVTNWQMQLLRGLGFTGEFEIVTPGSGVRPDAVKSLIANDLPEGLAGVGAVWQTFYADLADTAEVEAYVSSVADLSGGDDLCSPSDQAVDIASPAADSWSATRWISRLALSDGLAVGGENPGSPRGSPLSPHYTDTSSGGMMADAIRQAMSCGFRDFYWAHDDDLWNGPVSISRYTSSVRAAVAPIPVTPTIDGVPTAGRAVTCDEPQASDVTVAYAWSIDGQRVSTDRRYRLSLLAGNAHLACTVAVQRPPGPIVLSDSASVQIAPAPVDRVVRRPRLTGTPTIGHRLRVTGGKWHKPPAIYGYRWTIDGSWVRGGSSRSLVIPHGTRGRRISCTVAVVSKNGRSIGYADAHAAVIGGR